MKFGKAEDTLLLSKFPFFTSKSDVSQELNFTEGIGRRRRGGRRDIKDGARKLFINMGPIYSQLHSHEVFFSPSFSCKKRRSRNICKLQRIYVRTQTSRNVKMRPQRGKKKKRKKKKEKKRNCGRLHYVAKPSLTALNCYHFATRLNYRRS